MTVPSYLFQSPYSSPVQIGRRDPLSKEQISQEPAQSSVQQKRVSSQQDSKENSVFSSNSSINIAALIGSEGQKAADTFNMANTKIQAQSAYQNN